MKKNLYKLLKNVVLILCSILILTSCTVENKNDFVPYDELEDFVFNNKGTFIASYSEENKSSGYGIPFDILSNETELKESLKNSYLSKNIIYPNYIPDGFQFDDISVTYFIGDNSVSSSEVIKEGYISKDEEYKIFQIKDYEKDISGYNIVLKNPQDETITIYYNLLMSEPKGVMGLGINNIESNLKINNPIFAKSDISGDDPEGNYRNIGIMCDYKIDDVKYFSFDAFDGNSYSENFYSKAGVLISSPSVPKEELIKIVENFDFINSDTESY